MSVSQVCVVASSVPPKIGGSQVSVALMVRGFCELGVAVHLISSNEPEPELRVALAANGGSVDVVSAPPSDSTWDARILGLSNAVSQVLSQRSVDVVHAFSHGTAISSAIAMTQDRKTSLVASFHEMSSDQDIAGKSRSAFAYHLARVDAYIPLSSYFQRTAESYKVPSHKLHPSRQGIDIDIFASGDARRGEQLLRLGPSQRAIVYPARWVPAKAQTDLVNAFARVVSTNDVVLRLVGSTSASPHVDASAYKTSILELIKALNLEDKVALVEDIPRESMKHVYAAATVVAAPSHREGLGFVGIESMASGRPLVAAANEGFGQYCEHGVNSLVHAIGDVEALAEQLTIALNDENLCRTLVRNGFESARRYSYRAGVSDLMAIYEELLLNQRNGSSN